jgi:frataxin-like iron-binding protein CyaY
LDRIATSLEALQDKNPQMKIESDSSLLEIDLGPQVGKYVLQVDYDEQECILTSPVSGQLTYRYSSEIGDWLNVQDGHYLIGLLVRDMLRQIIGVPDL